MSGAQILGKYPEKLRDHDNPLNLGRGRMLPTTSWEDVWYGLAQWMGVPSSDMSTVLPNLGNFPKSDWLNQSVLFGGRDFGTTDYTAVNASATLANTTEPPRCIVTVWGGNEGDCAVCTTLYRFSCSRLW